MMYARPILLSHRAYKRFQVYLKALITKKAAPIDFLIGGSGCASTLDYLRRSERYEISKKSLERVHNVVS